VGDRLQITARLGLSDMVAKPCGFGTTEEGELDLTESDLLVLDEVLDLIDYGILDEQLLFYYLDNREDTEVVLTGRNPSQKLRRRADYITEMRCIKHPFDEGCVAREGVEF